MGREKEVALFHNRSSFRLKLGEHSLLVAAVRPENKAQIDAGFHSMSPESIRNRFLGSKKEFTAQELAYLTELDGHNHFALGVLEKEDARRGIAIVRMVRSSDDEKCAEVAITIIDEYQRRGLGTVLMNLIILAAKERGISKLSYTYFPQNVGIEKLLKKFPPLHEGESSSDTKHVWIDISGVAAEEIKARLRPFLPSI